MGRQRAPITTTRPGRRELPPEADAWVANAPATPPSDAPPEPAQPPAPPSPQPALSIVSDPTPPPQQSAAAGSVRRPPEELNDRPDDAAEVGAPLPAATVKFTLDVPLDMHRAMQIQKIRSRTSIVDTVRKILSKYYRTSADISPGTYPLKPGEPTKRSTFDLDEELVMEMNMQKVLRGAKVKDEVRQLLANHYMPGGSPTGN